MSLPLTAPLAARVELPEAAAAVFARACVFECGGRSYGIAVTEVREVAELLQVTPVPRAAAQVRGVANLRGVMVPVVDPSTALGHRPSAPRQVTPMIVLRDGREDVGLAVERVIGLLPMEAIEPVQSAGPGYSPAQATGAFRAGERWVVLLDGPALLETLRPPRLGQPELT